MNAGNVRRGLVALGVVVPALLSLRSATASYRVVVASSQRVVHAIEAEAPGGEASVGVVDLDEKTPPLVRGGEH